MMDQARRQLHLRGGGQAHAGRRTQLQQQFHAQGRGRHFHFDKAGSRATLHLVVPPPAKGAVADTLFTGKSGGGQPAPIKRGQKFVASGRQSAAATLPGNTIGSLHGPGVYHTEPARDRGSRLYRLQKKNPARSNTGSERGR